MRAFDESSTNQMQKIETEENTNQRISLINDELMISDVIICELRDLLTFIKSYKQIIDEKHPQTKSFEHWEELDMDLNAIASRLAVYEHQLHKEHMNDVA